MQTSTDSGPSDADFAIPAPTEAAPADSSPPPVDDQPVATTEVGDVQTTLLPEDTSSSTANAIATIVWLVCGLLAWWVYRSVRISLIGERVRIEAAGQAALFAGIATFVTAGFLSFGLIAGAFAWPGFAAVGGVVCMLAIVITLVMYSRARRA